MLFIISRQTNDIDHDIYSICKNIENGRIYKVRMVNNIIDKGKI